MCWKAWWTSRSETASSTPGREPACSRPRGWPIGSPTRGVNPEDGFTSTVSVAAKACSGRWLKGFPTTLHPIRGDARDPRKVRHPPGRLTTDREHA
jgi:hypothetical protein